MSLKPFKPPTRWSEKNLGQKPESYWKSELTSEQYRVCREGGTECSFANPYHEAKIDGVYHCVACGQALYDSDQKFDSGTGWPSFWQPIKANVLELVEDLQHGMKRVEVRCSGCHSHLGHVFEDGPKPTGQRYCMNSASMVVLERSK